MEGYVLKEQPESWDRNLPRSRLAGRSMHTVATQRIYYVKDHPIEHRLVEIRKIAYRLSYARAFCFPATCCIKAQCPKFRPPLVIFWETSIATESKLRRVTVFISVTGSSSLSTEPKPIDLSSRVGAEPWGWSKVSGYVPKCRYAGIARSMADDFGRRHCNILLGTCRGPRAEFISGSGQR